jgi:hypothetical protein
MNKITERMYTGTIREFCDAKMMSKMFFDEYDLDIEVIYFGDERNHTTWPIDRLERLLELVMVD